MQRLAETLQKTLASLTVRAWRLHLETPGVLATVPLLRGVWGAALKSLSPHCYASLFEGGAGRTPRYLMRPAPPEASPAPAVEFLLFGPHDEAETDAAWSAWEESLRRGLGPERRPAQLVAVHPLAWDGTALMEGRRQPGFRLHPLPWPGGDPTDPCRLVFEAPLRLLRDGRLITSPGLPDLTLATLRRLHALAGEAATTVWEAREEWLEIGRSHTSGEWKGRPLDLVRYSGRQKREVELHGVAGELPLPEGLGPLAELFAAAMWVHLGKSTVVGLGQIRVVPEE